MCFCLTSAAIHLGLGVLAACAFENAPVGSPIRNVELPSLRGGRHFLLSDRPVNVFLFIKPGLEYSNAFLREIALCEREMADKPVHWVTVVSSRVPRSVVEEEVRKARLQMPVLIDEGDALFSELGVVLYPTVGLADAQHKLVAYEPFRKVHYRAVIQARIRHLLGEISDEELEKVLHPPLATSGGPSAAAHRRLKLGEKLLQAKRYDKALESVERCLELDPTLAEAHVLLGRILAAQGKPDQARQAFEKALQLDPANRGAGEELKTLPESAR